MTNEGIKSICDALSDLINISEEKLAIIQSQCKHEKKILKHFPTVTGDVCKYCGKLIKINH